MNQPGYQGDQGCPYCESNRCPYCGRILKPWEPVPYYPRPYWGNDTLPKYKTTSTGGD